MGHHTSLACWVRQSAPLVAATLLAAGGRAAPAPAPAFPYQFLEEPGGPSFDVRAALHVEGASWPRGEARIAFAWQGSGRHDYVRIANGRAALLQVRGGRAALVGAAGALPPVPPERSLPVTLKVRPGRVTLVVGKSAVLRLALPAPPAVDGKVGTGVEGAGLGWRRVAYQPVEPADLSDDFMRSAGQTGAWEALSGQWRVSGAQQQARLPNGRQAVNAFRYEGEGDEQPAISAAGHWFWDDYAAQAAVRPSGGAAIGLCAYVQNARDYLLFRWTPGPAGERQLVRVLGGAEKVLARAPGGCEPGQWYRLGLRATQGRLQALIDDEPVLSAEDSAFGQGRIGLYVAGAHAEFDDVEVAGAGDRRDAAPTCARIPHLPAVIASDRLMRTWATEVGWWAPSADGFWHKGEFFGSSGLQVALPALAPGGAVWMALAASEPSFQRGYVLHVTVGQQAGFQLRREGQVVAVAQKPAEVLAGSGVILRRAGGEVVASAGGVECLRYTDRAPLSGRRIGVRGDGVTLDLAAAVPFSSNMVDWAFDEAPVGLWVARGVWDAVQRWVCWGRSHFGGGDSFSPVAWTKRDFAGDVTVACYAANATGGNARVERPCDMNLSLCGDGASIGSGYAFVVGGWDGTRCAIYRQGKKVAEAPMPPITRPAFNDWWAVRAARQGNRVALYVDDELIAHYTDPEPLLGGKVAFWSANGRTLALGRARIWYQGLAPTRPFPPRAAAGPEAAPALPAAVAPGALDSGPASGSNDFEEGLGTWTTRGTDGGTRIRLDDATAAGGKRSLRVENIESGGPFSVWISEQPFDAASHARLRFNYRIPAGVLVNLYAQIGRSWHEITLTGDVETPDRRVLGRIEGVQADGQWHHAEFDLLAAMRKLDPKAKEWKVRRLAFAGPAEPYLRAGLTGNFRGAAFHVDSFAIGP